MGYAVKYFTIASKAYETGYQLPLIADPAMLREFIHAAPRILAKMPEPRAEQAWQSLQDNQGLVYLPPAQQKEFERRFQELHSQIRKTKDFELASNELRALEEQMEALIQEAHLALQGCVAQQYAPLITDMKRNNYPMPVAVSPSAFIKGEKKLVAQLNDKLGRPLVLMSGTKEAAINQQKRQKPLKESKDWLSFFVKWGWTIDGVIFATFGALLASSAVMGPVGWALLGAVLLTTFIDKWQGHAAKTALVAGWVSRKWHGFYEGKNNIRQLNLRSWKPWALMGGLLALGLNLGFLGSKLFISASGLANQVLGAIYACVGVTYTSCSILLGLDRAMAAPWFHKIRNRSEGESTIAVEAAQAQFKSASLAKEQRVELADSLAELTMTADQHDILANDPAASQGESFTPGSNELASSGREASPTFTIANASADISRPTIEAGQNSLERTLTARR